MVGRVLGLAAMTLAALTAAAGIEHRFQRARHGGRSQIRAIIEPGKYTEAEARDLAVQLCLPHGEGLYLVNFFADPIVLQGWDGTGTAPERDQPHWLGRVPVEVANGHGYPARWWTCPEAISGRSEADVLRARGDR
jgi:hypothetical protein